MKYYKMQRSRFRLPVAATNATSGFFSNIHINILNTIISILAVNINILIIIKNIFVASNITNLIINVIIPLSIVNVVSCFSCSDASVVEDSGTVQLLANPHVAGPWLSPGKPTRLAVSTIWSNDLVVGEDHMLGQHGMTGKRAGVA